MIDIKEFLGEKSKIYRSLGGNKRFVLFLDYDGTLVEICDHPRQAIPTERVKRTLKALSTKENIDVFIISGRGLDDILSFFEKDLAERLNWIASHGAEVKLKKGPKVILDDAKVTVGIISDIRKSIERMLCDFPCYYIEDKKVSFSVHYRNCKEKDLSILEEVKEEIKKYEKRYKIDYMEMKKVIEVKPAGIDKGMAVDKILTKYGKSDFISIAIGDDVTDEYTFRANKKGINIKVSENRNMDTEADHFIHGPVQVLDFLDLLIYRPKGRLEIKR